MAAGFVTAVKIKVLVGVGGGGGPTITKLAVAKKVAANATAAIDNINWDIISVAIPIHETGAKQAKSVIRFRVGHTPCFTPNCTLASESDAALTG